MLVTDCKNTQLTPNKEIRTKRYKQQLPVSMSRQITRPGKPQIDTDMMTVLGNAVGKLLFKKRQIRSRATST